MRARAVLMGHANCLLPVTLSLMLVPLLRSYEGAISGEGTRLGREVVPDKEILTLTDYRQRYYT